MSNGGPGACPPCKIILCGGGARAGAEKIKALLDAADKLLPYWKELKATSQEYQKAVDAIEHVEHELEECATGLEDALNELSGL